MSRQIMVTELFKIHYLNRSSTYLLCANDSEFLMNNNNASHKMYAVFDCEIMQRMRLHLYVPEDSGYNTKD